MYIYLFCNRTMRASKNKKRTFSLHRAPRTNDRPDWKREYNCEQILVEMFPMPKSKTKKIIIIMYSVHTHVFVGVLVSSQT